MSTRSLPAVAIISMLLALGVAACGGDADDPEVATTAAAQAPAQSAPTTPPLGLIDNPAPLEAETAPKADSSTSVPKVADLPTPATAIAEPTQPSETTSTARTGDEPLVPELEDTGAWINSEPFTLASQRGKVVLVDFWTYTCINCIRTFPYLKDWHEKYANKGLVILGVHTPEFEFEQILDNVEGAVLGFGIEYPVVQDNDYGTWRAFENRFWPAKYLVDKDGYIRYTHFGEGAYDETEMMIRELLAEVGSDLSKIQPDTSPLPVIDVATRGAVRDSGVTRELYAGYERNFGALRSGQTPYVMHPEYYSNIEADVMYTDPGDHRNHFMYLSGLWNNTKDGLVHARQTEDYEDYVAIMFYATSVNAVMAPHSSEPFTLRVTIDDAPIEVEQAGIDVMFDEAGNTYVLVDQARMYRLVDQPEFSGHELKLSSNSVEFTLFAFTFGGYVGGEPGS